MVSVRTVGCQRQPSTRQAATAARLGQRKTTTDTAPQAHAAKHTREATLAPPGDEHRRGRDHRSLGGGRHDAGWHWSCMASGERGPWDSCSSEAGSA